MMEFAYPWLLTALVLPVLLYFYVIYLRRRPSVVVSAVEPFRKIQVKRRMTFSQWCILIALAVGIVALARPRLGDEKVMIRAQGIDIILALDLSGSMRAYDLPSDGTSIADMAKKINSSEAKNRIEVAKNEVRRFIENRPNDRIGLIGFADLAYSFVPPTLDHGWLLLHLDRLEPGVIGDTTGIASPIASGINRLKDSKAKRRVLVLFTDGRNTAENRLTPEQAAALGKEFNVILHTVGIGNRNACAIVNDMFGNARLQPIGDEFDEKLLQKLAASAGGSYFHAEDAAGMKRVMTEINRLEKTSVEQPKYMEYHEFAPKLALVSLALLLLGFTAANSWRLRLP